MRTEIDSKPQALDEVDRQIMQLEIEREALKKEKDEIIRPLDEVMVNHIQKAPDQANSRVEGKNGVASMLGINWVPCGGE